MNKLKINETELFEKLEKWIGFNVDVIVKAQDVSKKINEAKLFHIHRVLPFEILPVDDVASDFKLTVYLDHPSNDTIEIILNRDEAYTLDDEENKTILTDYDIENLIAHSNDENNSIYQKFVESISVRNYTEVNKIINSELSKYRTKLDPKIKEIKQVYLLLQYVNMCSANPLKKTKMFYTEIPDTPFELLWEEYKRISEQKSIDPREMKLLEKIELEILKRGKNGDIYIGNYREGLPNGFGKYIFADKSFFEGTFIDGLKQGKGRWIKPVIQIDPVLKTRKILKYEYEGNYKDSRKCGYGVFKWPSGSWYEGDFKDDFRDGFGVMHWIDGTYYEGEWVRGLQHGKGKLQMIDGTLKVGIFKDNLIVDEHYSEVPPYAIKILGSSDSSK
jgi:hypothetical protein